MSTSASVDRIIHQRLTSVLESITSAGFGKEQSGHIKLGPIHLTGVEIVNGDDTVLHILYSETRRVLMGREASRNRLVKRKLR